MITHWDENEIFSETAEGLDTDGEVHIQHFSDGFPLCWDQGRKGAFSGTTVEAEVSCKACVGYLRG